MSPLTLFRRVAIAEAITWALLLLGMFLKYVTETTELGVRVFGMLHGVVFIAYCLSTVLVAIDQRWKVWQVLLGLFSAIPPFMTVWFDRFAEKRGLLGQTWRLRSADAAHRGPLDGPAGFVLRNPLVGVVIGVLALALLTGLALLVGPPQPPGA